LKNIGLSFALFLGCLAPLAARAATVDPTSFPDGTYTATVERVVDAKHVQVVIDGKETTLAAGRDTVNFTKIQSNDQIKLSLIKGEVVVYADLTRPS
jgi:hypothetical protein